MKKFTLLIAFMLSVVGSYGQISYEYGWEPTGLGNWVNDGSSGDFSRTTTLSCEGDGSARANVYYNGTSRLRSPNLGTSNGGEVTLEYDYKVVGYFSTSTGAAASTVLINVEWATSASGPWYVVQTINSTNHTVSSSCAQKSITFFPPEGDLYVRFSSTAVGSLADLYYYYDNINVIQDASPSCLYSIANTSSITANSAELSWDAPSVSPVSYDYYYSSSNTAPDSETTPLGNISEDSVELTELTASTQYYFWVRSNCGDGDVSGWSPATAFTTLESCFAPSEVTASPSAQSATVSWTSPDEVPANGYQYYYSTDNTAPDAETTPSGNSEEASVTIDELEPNTAYYIWVRSNCGEGDVSVWSSSYNFTTDCLALTAPTALEDFSSYTGAMPGPDCWLEANGSLDSDPVSLNVGTSTWSNQVYNNVVSHPNGTAAYINLYGADEEWIISPAVDLGDGSVSYRLEYDASVTPWTGTNAVADMEEKFVKVVVSTDGGDTWSEADVIQTYDNDNIPAGGVSEGISLEGYSGVIKIGFYAYSEETSTDLRFFIDNWRIIETPACEKPGDITFEDITFTSATASWTASESEPENGYEYYYSEDDSAPAVDATVSGAVEAGETSAELDDLTAETTYYVWVRSVCGEDNSSEWEGPAELYTGYCTPAPSSVDGIGIINVTMGDIDNDSEDEDGNYGNYSDQVTDAFIGATVDFAITYETGFTYGTKIWIDWNNDLEFNDEDELVYEELSDNDEPTTLSGSFVIPATAAPGVHRVRIGATDNDEGPSSPCYTGAYGSFEDYSINLIMPDAPVITEFTPDTYCAVEGELTITGTSLTAATVTIGETEITLTTNTDTEITATIPAGVSGIITVETVGGTDSTEDEFSVIAPTEIEFSIVEAEICEGTETEAITIVSGASAYDTFEFAPADSVSGDAETGFVFSPEETTNYVVTASNSETGCIITQSYTVTVNPFPSPLVITPSPAIICSGSVQPLEVEGGILGGEETVGEGTDLTATDEEFTVFCNRRDTHKSQTIYTAADLNAAGLGAGSIVSIAYNVNSIGSAATNDDFTVKMGTTTLDAFPNSSYIDESDFVTVLEPTTYTHEVGVNTLTFTTPFEWDGVSNIVISISQSGADSLYNAQTYYTDLGANTAIYNYNDLFAETGTPTTKRFNVTFDIEGSTEITWSPITNLYTDADATVAYTEGANAAIVYFKSDVAVEETYTVTSTSESGCSISSTVDVSVNVVAAPTGEAVQQIAVDTAEEATIENIEVIAEDGAVVTWYASEEDFEAGNALPEGAVVVSGETYYAAQTIGECTSQELLAVTVDVVLGKEDFDSLAFSYYPNPVSNVLNLTYSQDITSVTVFNLLGQQVVNMQPNATEVRIDMSALAEGGYIVNIYSGDTFKTIKVIKKK